MSISHVSGCHIPLTCPLTINVIGRIKKMSRSLNYSLQCNMTSNRKRQLHNDQLHNTHTPRLCERREGAPRPKTQVIQPTKKKWTTYKAGIYLILRSHFSCKIDTLWECKGMNRLYLESCLALPPEHATGGIPPAFSLISYFRWGIAVMGRAIFRLPFLLPRFQ